MSSPEQCLRFGPEGSGARVLFVPPLFDEANRMRRTLAMTMRALSARGVASLLPDLPGQNDSIVPTHAVDLPAWRGALGKVVAAEQAPIMIASIRGGGLIDDGAGAIGWWRLAPVAGGSLLRTMLRAQVASDREAGTASSADGLMAEAERRPLLLAGNLLSSAMIAGLRDAQPAAVEPCRTVMLGNGAGQIAGSPLWLRAEPGEDAALAQAMADDIAAWVTLCAAR